MRPALRTKSLMAADMADQADVLRRLIAGRDELRTAVRRVVPHPLTGIAIVGRGSSGNAGVYGRLLLEISTGLPVASIPPSMIRLYHTETDAHGWLGVGLSQSGRTIEVHETLASLRRRGGVTIGLTADPLSPLAGAADLVLDLRTWRERAVPATKTFTAELAVLAMLAEALGGVELPARTWEAAADAVDDALADGDPARAAAAFLAGATHVSTIGSGLLVGVALEAALKITETARVPATGWSSASFRHGPMAIAGGDHPVVAFVSEASTDRDVARTTEYLTGVPTVIVGDTAHADVDVTAGLPEALFAIPAAVRAQQIALELAHTRRVDPDRPPRLRKVTPS